MSQSKKKPTDDLVRRLLARIKKGNKGRFYTQQDDIRAEYALLAGRVKKLKKATGDARALDTAPWEYNLALSLALSDVLDIIRTLRK